MHTPRFLPAALSVDNASSHGIFGIPPLTDQRFRKSESREHSRRETLISSLNALLFATT